MRALCLGSAACVWRDAAEALALFEPDLVIACNDIGAAWPKRIDHWASLHPEKLPEWLFERVRRGHPVTPQMKFWACETKKGPRGVTHLPDAREGSSGLLCVRVAEHLGAERIVLAGVPLVGMRHIDGESRGTIEGRAWEEAEKYRPAWLAERTTTLANVRSMSGWTREILGPPDAAWLSCGG